MKTDKDKMKQLMLFNLKLNNFILDYIISGKWREEQEKKKDFDDNNN